jgi:hypothetical protein
LNRPRIEPARPFQAGLFHARFGIRFSSSIAIEANAVAVGFSILVKPRRR